MPVVDKRAWSQILAALQYDDRKYVILETLRLTFTANG